MASQSNFHLQNLLPVLTIDLNAERNYSNNLNENYQVSDRDYLALNSNEFGNFGISTILIKTAFSGGDGPVNKNFQNFRKNRLIIANRLAAQNGTSINNRDDNGFPGVILGSLPIILAASFSRFLSGPRILMLLMEPSLDMMKFTYTRPCIPIS